jgi:hypothetical protein
MLTDHMGGPKRDPDSYVFKEKGLEDLIPKMRDAPATLRKPKVIRSGAEVLRRAFGKVKR